MLRIVPLEQLNRMSKDTLMEVLDIRITAVGADFIEAEMPVDRRTHQVFHILHGGASAALAETLGSIGGHLALADPEGTTCVGLELNANHIRGVSSGKVRGRATPIHVGKSTQVWDIRITDEQGRLVCISRLTLAVVPKRAATN